MHWTHWTGSGKVYIAGDFLFIYPAKDVRESESREKNTMRAKNNIDLWSPQATNL